MVTVSGEINLQTISIDRFAHAPLPLTLHSIRLQTSAGQKSTPTNPIESIRKDTVSKNKFVVENKVKDSRKAPDLIWVVRLHEYSAEHYTLDSSKHIPANLLRATGRYRKQEEKLTLHR